MNDYLGKDRSISTKVTPLSGVDDFRFTVKPEDIPTITQAFEIDEKIIHHSPEEPTFYPILLDWANRQPSSPIGFLDVAAGIGKEAKVLGENGYTCIAQDPSVEMIRNNQHNITKLGSAEKLDYPDNSLSGIINKSAWIFLSLLQRRLFLHEAQRTLVPGGSILLQSERTDIHRAYYKPRGSEIAQCLPSTDFNKYGDVCYEEWLLEIARLKMEHEVALIQYSCLPSDVVILANQAGLIKVAMIEYGLDHPLATQNRWIRQSGFIIELQKV